MKTLQARLVKYLEKNPHRELLGADICKKAEQAMQVTGGSVERRLRILAEVSEGHDYQDTPEHMSALELLGGGKVKRTKKDGLVYFTYEPPATQRVRRVKIENGRAIEYYEDVITSTTDNIKSSKSE